MIAWVLRVKKRLLAKGKQDENEVKDCSQINVAQKSLHSCLKKDDFKMLSPFIDDEDIIRVGGHMDKAIVFFRNEASCLATT